MRFREGQNIRFDAVRFDFGRVRAPILWVFSRRTGIDRGRNRLAVALEEARRASSPIIDLTLSNPTQAQLPYNAEELLQALRDPEVIFYRPDPFGLLSAREAIASDMAKQGLSIHPERILLTASTSDAYAYLLKLLCDPDDEVLVPQPSYPLFEHLANLESVRLRPYRIQYDGQWHVDIDEIKRSLTQNTRAILLVSPNNPTGSFLKRDELHQLSRLGLPLICDEVFSSYPLIDDTQRITSAIESDETLVFSLFGLSKLVGLPQLKLSWTCINGPRALVEEARERIELIADTYLSVGTQVQLAVPRLLNMAQPVSDAIRDRTKRNLAQLRQMNSASSLLHVEGGWYATLRLPNIKTDEQWALDLLEKDGVSVYPGYFFDYEEPSVIVVSLIVPETLFTEGARRLAQRTLNP
jgi:alanine-synthesizing transaminase